MKGLNSKVFIALLSLNEGSIAAAQEGSGYMLDLSYAALKSSSTIRVKVFPHDKDYKPQGFDQAKDTLVLEAEKPCTVFEASRERAAPQGAPLQKTTRVVFDAKVLKHNLLVRCQGPYKLVRGANVPHFQYNGSLIVRALSSSELEAVNYVDLETYLRGVVPSEVYRDWPMETLKTQAVAARTYAAYHLLHARRFATDRNWDVDDTINFQAYTGNSLISERTDQAIAETQGQILTFRGQVIQAYYHADSGGQTEDAASIWGQQVPFTVARPEAQETEMNKTVWEKPFQLISLEKEMHEAGLLESGRSLRSIVVPIVGRSPSGRVKSLAVIDNKGEYHPLGMNLFRKVIGQLPSPLFTLEKDASVKSGLGFLVRGIGFGHGVGMSQQGAAALAAQKSWNYRQILDYYYVHTTLCSLNGTVRDHGPALSDCTSLNGVAQASK